MSKRFAAGFCLALFLLLVASGIIVKRVYGHGEFMILFHLPAAVFLILFLRIFMEKRNQKYRREIEAIRRPEGR